MDAETAAKIEQVSANTGVARRGVKFLGGGKQVLVENLAIVNDGVFTKVK
jgi:hypothetical protein